MPITDPLPAPGTTKRADDPQWRRMFALMARLPLTREEHHEFLSMLLDRPRERPVTSRKQLTPLEVRLAVAGYEGYLLMAVCMRDARGTGRRMTEPDTTDEENRRDARRNAPPPYTDSDYLG